MPRSNFSDAQKRSIVEQAENRSPWAVASKYGIKPALIYSWRRKFQAEEDQMEQEQTQNLEEEKVEISKREEELMSENFKLKQEVEKRDKIIMNLVLKYLS